MRHGQELSVISGAWANQLKREGDEAQPRIVGDKRYMGNQLKREDDKAQPTIVGDKRCMGNQLKREDDKAQPRITGDKRCMGKPTETRRRLGAAKNYWR